jgi:outer membrane lipoprotein LolB
MAWLRRVSTMEHYRVWSLTGRIALRVEQDGWSAGVHWSQQEERFDIRLTDPLGRGIARLEGDAGSVLLRTSEGDSLRAESAEALLARELGWYLPLSGLRYWVLGIPDPREEVAQRVLDDSGRLDRLQQSGWAVRYARYTDPSPLALPEKITLSQSTVTVKLVVDQWNLLGL